MDMSFVKVAKVFTREIKLCIISMKEKRFVKIAYVRRIRTREVLEWIFEVQAPQGTERGYDD